MGEVKRNPSFDYFTPHPSETTRISGHSLIGVWFWGYASLMADGLRFALPILLASNREWFIGIL
jgi:hypothetical protein